MFVQKPERVIAPHGMPAVEKFDLRFIALIKLVVQVPDFSVFIGHPLIRLHHVVVTTLHHKRPWKN